LLLQAVALQHTSKSDFTSIFNSVEYKSTSLPGYNDDSKFVIAFPRTTPFGPYGGLLAGFLNPDRQSENQERLEALGAGSGAADVEYEQFLKAKEAGVDFVC